jgi:hypothetical protein
MEHAMSSGTKIKPNSKPAPGSIRFISGFAVLFFTIEGLINLLPWPVVSEMMDRIGHGSGETVARLLGSITNVCAVLCPMQPTSILGAILLMSDLSGAVASQIRIGSAPVTLVMFGCYASLIVCGGLWLRNRIRQMRRPVAGLTPLACGCL